MMTDRCATLDDEDASMISDKLEREESFLAS